MPRFAFTATVNLQVEADTVQEASAKFIRWRKFIVVALDDRLEEAGIRRCSIPPVHEFTEVNAAWLENQKLRNKFRQEWEYETREEPVAPGSKLMLTYRIATGPKSAAKARG